ncbi:MAG: phage tail tape measure protein [Reinekea sp.]
MALNFAVSTIFGARDENTKAFNRMSKNAKLFGDKSSKAFNKANRSASHFGDVVKGILTAGAISKVFGTIKQGAAAATMSFLNFDQAITAASAKFTDLDLSTKEGQKTLMDLRMVARQVGRDTEHSADQAAQGLDFLAMAGFNARQSISLLPGVANFATAANTDFARAADIASDSIGAFGLMTKDSAQLAKNFGLIQDVMAKTTVTSNTNLEQLFETIKSGAPSFTAAGQSIQSFSALAGTLANSGIKAEMSGTALRNVILRLSDPTSEAADAMDQLGIKTQDSKGNFLDIMDILDSVRKGTSKLGTAQKSAALSTIFGARAQSAINILLNSSDKQLRAYRKSLTDSTGAADKMANTMRGSLINKLKGLGSALTEVAFQFLDAFAGKGANAIDKFTAIVRRIDMTPVINGFKFLISAGQSLFEKFKKVGESTGLFKTIGELVTELTPLFSTLFDIVKTVFNVLSDAGVFDFIANRFKNLITSVIILSKVFRFLWFNVLKPFVTWFGENILGPIVKFMSFFTKLKGDALGFANDFATATDEKGGSRADARRALEAADARQAPNRLEVQTRASYYGQLDITGAPAGSTYTEKKKNMESGRQKSMLK